MPSWSPEFETAHAAIDAEHREFFRRLDILEAAIATGESQKRAYELIATLQSYVLKHFAHEEAYMLRVRCPAYETNCRAHQEFTRKFAEWLKQLTGGTPPIGLTREIHRQSSAWIKSHIADCDCALRGCKA